MSNVLDAMKKNKIGIGGFSLTNNKLVGGIANFVSENASTLTMVGSIVTLGMSLYEAFKAAEAISKEKEESAGKIEKVQSEAISEPEKAAKIKEIKTERNFKYVFIYKWAIMFGILSAILMMITKWIDGMTIAGLTALGVRYQDKLKSFMNHTKEVVGEEKFKEIDDKTVEEKVLKNFFGEDGPQARKFSPRLGNRLWVDAEEGIIFQMNLKDAQDTLDHAEDYFKRCGKNGFSQSKYLEMFGLSKEEIRRQIGQNRYTEKWWGPNAPFKPSIGTVTVMGATFPSIQFAYPPTSAERAGIVGAKKLIA